MADPKIRLIALCVCRRKDKILVMEGYDSVKEQSFFRPLGGGIEFGELGAEAVVRELMEEIDDRGGRSQRRTNQSSVEIAERFWRWTGTALSNRLTENVVGGLSKDRSIIQPELPRSI